MNKIEELAPPHTIRQAANAREILRVWIVDGQQHVSISGDIWDDPAAWGLMLVDLAKHAVNVYAERGRDKGATMQRILAGFRAEIESPTDEPGPVP